MLLPLAVCYDKVNEQRILYMILTNLSMIILILCLHIHNHVPCILDVTNTQYLDVLYYNSLLDSIAL